MIRSAHRGRLGALLVSAALGAGVLALGASSAQATADFAITRIAGADRAATAAQLALQAYPVPPGAPTAIVVRDDTFPDALAGNFAAGLFPGGGAPILLSGTNDVPAVTMSALTTLGTDNVLLLGGTTALSPAVAAELSGAGITVTRIGGADRFATAAAIATGSGGPPSVGTNEDGLKTAVVSSGLNFPDALAAGPIVFSEHFPQLLTTGAALPSVTKSTLTSLGIQHVILTGGTGAVPQSVQDEIDAMPGMTVERIAGGTRFTTAIELAKKAGTAFGFQDEHVNLATAANFPDALAGGPHGGKEQAATILVPPTATSGEDFTAVCGALQAIAPNVATAHAFGGPVAISDAVLAALDTCATPGTPAPGTGQVVTANPGGDEYSFVQTSDNMEVDVEYNANDTFRVDGVVSTQAAFEAAITPGDDITYTNDTTPADVDVHDLTNRTVTSGMVGEVNIGADQLAIINPVTGDRVSAVFTYAPGSDVFAGVGNTAALFEQNVSEGDTITITEAAGVETYTLTNGTITGVVTLTESAAGVTVFQVGPFGDRFEDQLVGDVTFHAEFANAASEDYTVGGVATDWAGLTAAASVGDTLAYSRAGGVELFALTNAAPPLQSGQAFGSVNIGDDTLTFVEADGDVVTADYTGGTITVNGASATEDDLVDAFTPGDAITYVAADPATNPTADLTLTDQLLQGQIDVPAAPTDEYDVLALDNATVLDTITYEPSGDNRYFINGSEVTLTVWEQRLDDLVIGPGAEFDDLVQFIPGTFNEHRLATNDPFIP